MLKRLCGRQINTIEGQFQLNLVAIMRLLLILNVDQDKNDRLWKNIVPRVLGIARCSLAGCIECMGAWELDRNMGKKKTTFAASAATKVASRCLGKIYGLETKGK